LLSLAKPLLFIGIFSFQVTAKIAAKLVSAEQNRDNDKLLKKCKPEAAAFTISFLFLDSGKTETD
jgi:hypothetical protein